ncbi:hypothetical protein LOC67_00220 [Stieleria sp. JC731]|uniref:glycosyltransferase n=1 Tax=Pirellulaceae TaxID=2691357 RepID=UPI001E608657|nr:nucleotide disphospho-sugar-binding domain-containing protein [Stieleria sp. JC731]MCC9598964.1 hypothetical protein [Stieleria sp. JC731]
MSRRLRIDFLAPPFAGHLYPLLQLAKGLADRGFDSIRFFSTPEAESAIKASGFSLCPLVSDRSHIVFEIANTDQPIGSNPLRLHGQFKLNLSLMSQLRSELQEAWSHERPDLVVADFTVPVAGLLARQIGIRWWTSLPTVCVLDTPDGTPAYLGGWAPPKSFVGQFRDTFGRQLVRGFKRGVYRAYRGDLKQLGLDAIYRQDGYEAIYSEERILGLGIREFEFPCRWPASLDFIGPLTASPTRNHQSPCFVEGKRHVLVSLGTHLRWAKERARKIMRQLAKHRRDLVVHFTHGDYELDEVASEGNFFSYPYIPYQAWIDRYDAVIHHGGTGVTYACIRAGIPVLVWPQDYDQFDHAARIVHHGIGLRLRPDPQLIGEDLNRLWGDRVIQENVRAFSGYAAGYRPVEQVADWLAEV